MLPGIRDSDPTELVGRAACASGADGPPGEMHNSRQNGGRPYVALTQGGQPRFFRTAALAPYGDTNGGKTNVFFERRPWP